MDFTLIFDNLPLFFQGFRMTIFLLITSLPIGFGLAFLCACACYYSVPIVKPIARAYIELFRGTPLLIQVFFIYYGLAQADWIRQTPFLWVFFEHAWTCAILALSLNTGAYTAEILLGTMRGVSRNELEVGHAFGMSERLIFFRILMPSALRRLIPLYANETVFLIQSTAVVSAITLVDLTAVAREINAYYYMPFEAFITAGVFYLVFVLTVIKGFKWLERRYLKN